MGPSSLRVIGFCALSLVALPALASDQWNTASPSNDLESLPPASLNDSNAPLDSSPVNPPGPPPSEIPQMPAEVPAPDVPPPTPQSLPATQGPRGSVSFQTFYDELSAYGSWIQTPDYGWVWLPAGETSDWQPYTTGQWIYTADYGYCWIPDESWGWAPFHYGNWISTPSYGWAWVPGYTWGPGWVDWYYGAGYVGWAPLPAAFYGYGYGFGYAFGGYGYGYNYGGGGYYNGVPSHPRVAPDTRNNVRNVIDPNHYVYVPANKFQGQKVSQVMTRPANMNAGIFEKMHHVDRVPTTLRSSGQTIASAPRQQVQPGQMLGGARVLDGSHPPAPVNGFNHGQLNPSQARLDPGARNSGAIASPTQHGLPPLTGSSVVPSQPHASAPAVVGGHQIETRPWSQQAVPRFSPTPRISQPTGGAQISHAQSAPIFRPQMQMPMSRGSGPVQRAMPRSMPSHAMPHSIPHFGGGHHH
jgi:hypothetical protein